MSVPFYSNIDLSKNQILNVVFQILPSAPSSPVEGQFYYNSTDKAFYFYNGTAWVTSQMELPEGIVIDANYVHTDNNFTNALLSKLNGIEANANNYVLPTANATTLGGVKIGDNISISSGVISVLTATTGRYGVVQLNNTLTSTSVAQALTAAQGKTLKDLIDGLTDNLDGLGTAANVDIGTAAGNVPVLGSDGKLNTSVIPALAITEVYECNSQSEMLALNAQQGDFCIRTDINYVYILKQTPASTLANWIPVEIPGGVASVNGKTGSAIVLTADDIDYTSGVSIKDRLDKIKNDYVTNIGNGTAKSFTITHNLGTKDVMCEIYEVSSGETVYVDIARTTTNAVVVTFATAPATNQFRIIIRKAIT